MVQGKKERKMGNKKVKVIDTSVLVHDPVCLQYLVKNEVISCIPWTVLEELDGLKMRPDIGFDVRQATRTIEDMRNADHPLLQVVRGISWKGIEFLDKTLNDHRIIASANALKEQYGVVEIMSKDTMMRIKARELGFVAEDYYRDQVEQESNHDMPRVEVPFDEIDKESFTFAYKPEIHGEIPFNGGVVCISDWKGDFKRPEEKAAWGEQFAAIKRHDYFRIIPKNLQAFGIRPYSGADHVDPETTPNWPQNVALYLLSRNDISLVFLEGGAGTGKTLIALAGALERKKDFRQILITRPMVHLEDKDNMGFLPGDIREKMDPWLRPIWQNLSVLKEVDPQNRELIDKYLADKKIDIEPLDYIRGTTFIKSIMIIDEAQNLTPHQVKTIITRAGVGTKLVFTGDLDQIDRKRRLDRFSNGLAYAAGRMLNQEIVGHVKFHTSVRSELAKIGVDLL
jgi:PhoH-like ATPase